MTRINILAVALAAALPSPVLAQDVVVMRQVIARPSASYAWKATDGACSGEGQRTVAVTCQRDGSATVADSMCKAPKPSTTRADAGCTVPRTCGTFSANQFIDPMHDHDPAVKAQYTNYRTAAGTVAQQKAEAKSYCESVKARSCALNMGYDGGKDGAVTSVYASTTKPAYSWPARGHLFASECN